MKRVVDKQLALAIAGLRATRPPRRNEAVRAARRHVKKIRALMRLIRPTLGDTYQTSKQDLRAANRLLAPIADGQAVVDTMARLRRKPGFHANGRTLSAIRSALVARAARIDRSANVARALPRASALLRVERARVAGWTLNAHGFGAIAPGLETSMRRARRAMRRALSRPTTEHYHAWRQRVEDLWFHVRLIEERAGGRLLATERGLEALDGCLGEDHDVAIVERLLTTETPVSRRETAASLRLLRRYRLELRSVASVLGAQVLDEKPRDFVRRVRQLCRSAANGAPAGRSRLMRDRIASRGSPASLRQHAPAAAREARQ